MSNARIVLLLGFAVLLFNSGMRFSLGLLLLPMGEELGWTRTTLSTMATVYMVITAAALPFTGRLVDYFGALRVLVAGVILTGTSILLTSFVNQPWQAYATYGVLFAIGSAATSITPIGVLLSRVYPERTGLANSVAISGMGMGQLLIISVLSAWLVELGWRGSFLWMGIASMACVLPLLYWCKSILFSQTKAYDKSDEVSGASAVEPGSAESNLKKVLLHSRTLWLVLAIYAICGFQDFFIATHIVAFAADESLNLSSAGSLLAFMGLAGLAGVLLTGLIADKHGPVWPTVLCFIVRCVIFTLILVSREAWVIATVALLYGATFWITAPLTVVFARQIADHKLLGTISGLITMIHHALGGLGAIYGAFVHDHYGSYDMGLITMLLLSLIALLLSMLLPRYLAKGRKSRSSSTSVK